MHDIDVSSMTEKIFSPEALRILFAADGMPYVATEPSESTMCVVDGAKVQQVPSVMTSRMVRPATRAEVEAWRDGK